MQPNTKSKIYLKPFSCSSVFIRVCVCNVWLTTTLLLPVWPKDVKRLDTQNSEGQLQCSVGAAWSCIGKHSEVASGLSMKKHYHQLVMCARFQGMGGSSMCPRICPGESPICHPSLESNQGQGWRGLGSHEGHHRALK